MQKHHYHNINCVYMPMSLCLPESTEIVYQTIIRGNAADKVYAPFGGYGQKSELLPGE